MAQKTFTVEVQGLEQLHARLQKGRLLSPTREFIADLAKAGQRTAQRAAKPHPADKGTLGRAIHITMKDGGETAIVEPHKSISGIAFTIEEGRRPGRRPPYKGIKRWLISHGIITGARGDSKKIQEVREQIAAHGTKGVHFMAQAQEATDRALHQGIPRTEQEIENIWERR